MTLPHGEGVVAVREDDGGKLSFIGEEVATMDVSDGDLVFPPMGFAGGGVKKKRKLQHQLLLTLSWVAVLTSGIAR